jgi:hypothetical protein
MREVWRKPNLQPGSPFFAYFLAAGALRVSEAKKVSGRAARKRKVKRYATNTKTQLILKVSRFT